MSWKPSVPKLLVGIVLLSAAAGAFLAATPWLRAYQVAHAPLLLALAAVLPVVISVVAWRVTRSSVLVSYAVSGTGLVILLVVSNGFDFYGTWDPLVHVPAQLLTETLPLSGGSSLLAAPVVLTWLCGAVSAELLGRPSRPSALGTAVPVAYFALAFVATTSGPAGGTVPEGAALLGVLVVCALARQGLIEAEAARAGTGRSATGQEPARRRSSWRRAAAGAVMAAALVVSLGAGIGSVPALASRPTTVSRPTQLLSGMVVDPLDTLAALRRSGSQARDLFDVQVQKAWSGYIPVAALDEYDGDTWSFSATFRPTGGRVPSPATLVASEPEAQPLVQRYTLEGSTGLPFLPALDRPEQVDGLAVDADSSTGMLAALPAIPASYSVVSLVPPGTIGQLSSAAGLAFGAEVPGGGAPAYTALPVGSAPDVAAAVRFAASLTGLPATPSVAFLQSLSSSLRAQERRVAEAGRSSGAQSAPAALAGTSLAQVMNAVTVDRVATPEQFATFFAVVARYLGVPVRVLTGFRAPAAGSTHGPLPPGDYQLTNRDAWAWDEVPVLGYGWVVADPSPVRTTADVSAPPEQVTASPTTVPKQVTALPGGGAAHAIAKPVNVKLAHPLNIDWLLVAGAGVPAAIILALLVGGLGLPALRRCLRRRARHQTGDPALLTAGAWLELIDGLFRLGVQVDGSATSRDVTAEVTSRFGDAFGPPTNVLADLADQALYSTEWPVDEVGARLAWDTQRQIYSALRSSVGQRDRARSLLLVGPSPARPGPGGGP
ncbi:MAG: transglutaminaseTgpA domain-containing protein [Acidimicrobiales bacterium]